jgi:uncharacterized membrane protein
VKLPDGNQTSEVGGRVRLRVSLASRPRGKVTVAATSSDPTEGIAVGTLFFGPTDWTAPRDLVVVGQPDHRVDGDRNYRIRLEVHAPADQALQSLRLTPIDLVNRDDDVAQVVLLPRSEPATSESGGEVIVDVGLTSQPVSLVRLTLEVSDSTEAAVSPASVTFTPRNWAGKQALTVRGLPDLRADGDVPYRLIASVRSADPNYARLEPQQLLLVNRDRAAFSGIGVLSDGVYSSTAQAVSADGTVVVGAAGGSAIRWTASDGMVAIAAAPSIARAIDGMGKTIVGGLAGQATVWRDGGGAEPLPPFMPGLLSSEAVGLSPDATTIVGWGLQLGSVPAGLVWRGDKKPTPSLNFQASSEDGSVLVGYGTYSKPYSSHYAARNGDTLAFVPACITPVFCNAEALDVSGDGLQVVGFSQASSATSPVPVHWDISAGTAVALSPDTGGKALGISRDGKRIVGYEVMDSSVATTWTNQGSRTVQELLAGAGVLAPGWQLTVARATSQDGQVIVGDGVNPQGQSEGWIAVVPHGL